MRTLFLASAALLLAPAALAQQVSPGQTPGAMQPGSPGAPPMTTSPDSTAPSATMPTTPSSPSDTTTTTVPADGASDATAPGDASTNMSKSKSRKRPR